MKIVFLSQYFFPEQFSNNEIAKDMVARGHEVDVITCVPNYPAGQFFEGYSNKDKRRSSWEGVEIYRCFTVARGTKNWHLALNYLLYPFAATWTLVRRVRKRHDVSFVSMPSPLFQAFAGVFLRWIRGTPTVYWVQDIWPESAVFTLRLRSKFAVRLLEMICGWLYRKADLILVQSQAFPPMIERFGVPPEKIQFFPNTAPKSYRPLEKGADDFATQRVPGNRFTLMFAGNIGESQSFDTLIDAIQSIKDEIDLEVAVVGTGRDLDRVQKRVADEGLQQVFNFVGRHPEDMMPAFFAQADVMLVSLKKNPIFELTVPYKIQCYMACAKPILAALDGEGARIITEAKAGLTAPSEDATALGVHILALSQMPRSTLTEMGQNAHSYFAKNYHFEHVYNNLDAVLAKIANP